MTSISTASPEQPITATCHCGAVTITAPRLPDHINECKCSMCRRYAAAWAYYKLSEVTVTLSPTAEVKQYIWGDRTATFNWCGACGVMCYWWPIDRDSKGEDAEMGLNTRNVDPEVLRFVEWRVTNQWINEPLANPSERHKDDKATY